ncbi:DUF6261 family protein [Gaoshiqia sediminis]|uniref:DUF6261 family protein n=1 Tax=Gaoshiqia sediminis TaxID=2986998 RepID=A0AA41YAR9_9BACT|nr:DUF6261 family protein [Gaoshiqia sediminis]MCW0482455.1 DUF6261 family protein [Gaoshiqia sediminis]
MDFIQTTYLARMRNNEHYQFMSDVANAINKATPAALQLDSVYPVFTAALARLNATLLIDQGSATTEQITAMDVTRDRTWSALNERMKSSLLSPIEAETESAKAVKRVLDLYGNVRNLSYNEESAAITNLVEDLEKPQNAAHCSTLGISGWVAALKQQNLDFQALIDSRNIELANKDSADVKKVREEIDPVYQNIVKRINAQVTLEIGTAVTETFIRELNQRIKYYNDTLAARAGRASTAQADTPAEPVTE